MTSATDWLGRVGDVWAAEWRRTDRSFVDLSRHLDAAILAAAPERGAALDIGCGAGSTSFALAAARPALAITGIDLSEGLIAVARERAGNCPNARFLVDDAAHPPVGPYDLLYSRHGVMFFPDPARAFAALRAAASPGAPLIFSCFRAPDLNPWAGEVARAVGGEVARAAGYAPGPFAFADRDFVAGVLRQSGWRDADARAIDVRYRAGEGPDAVDDAAGYLQRIGPAAAALAAAPRQDRPALVAGLRDLLARHFHDGAVDFPAAAWIWSARA